MGSLKLNFYGVGVEFLSDSSELLELLRKDFSFFLRDSIITNHFIIKAYLDAIPIEKIPKIPAWRRSHNSITYDVGAIRYNDYHGKLLSIYDYEREEAQLFSESLSRLHEISYLLILSRVGKKMDLLGWHKLHAFGVIKNSIACLGVMPMGMGKSTLLTSLIKNSEVEILSDDTPLVSTRGEVKAFPIRIGLIDEPSGLEILEPEKNIYQLEREHYGLKRLISLDGVPNKVGEHYKKVLLMKGIRVDRPECRINSTNKLIMLGHLFYHMVIGVGLPMIFEYFWERGSKDFLVKTKIFLLRLRSSWNLTMKSETYTIILGNDIDLNAQTLQNFLDEK